MAPLDLSDLAGTLPHYAVFLAIGLGFGATLELAGFGDSRKLAGQFYLGDMTVLKVMFTAIVVAAVLIGGASSLGLLDLGRVFVNPTYLAPGVVGGLIMGLGFIVGGFCPGTSVVAASTLKIDGIFFLGGVGIGVLLFSETVHLFEGFWHSTYMGRFTLPELLSLPAGVTIALLAAMAVLMFLAAEVSERVFGRGERPAWSILRPRSRAKMAAAGLLLGTALIFASVGQPDAAERWAALAGSSGIDLDNRDPFVHPAEVVEWREDQSVYVRVIDVRSEADFNRFHLLGSSNVGVDGIEDPAFLATLRAVPDNTLIFVVSNGEAHAVAAWKILKGEGIGNVYIVEGGMNGWLAQYPPDPCIATPVPRARLGDEEVLAYEFNRSVGDHCFSAHPEAPSKEPPTDCYLEAHPELKRGGAKAARDRENPFIGKAKPAFERKVKMKKKGAVKGGCG